MPGLPDADDGPIRLDLVDIAARNPDVLNLIDRLDRLLDDNGLLHDDRLLHNRRRHQDRRLMHNHWLLHYDRSGLDDNREWAMNEEMTAWVANQAPKMFEVFTRANAI